MPSGSGRSFPRPIAGLSPDRAFDGDGRVQSTEVETHVRAERLDVIPGHSRLHRASLGPAMPHDAVFTARDLPSCHQASLD